MNLQFIHDNNGNTTGVFLPIEEWQTLKAKYSELQKEEAENLAELAPWQKKIIDERLSDYYKNPSDVADFNKVLDVLEKCNESGESIFEHYYVTNTEIPRQSEIGDIIKIVRERDKST